MGGRGDFVVLLGRIWSDPRIVRAGELYVASKLAREETATATVVGHIAAIAQFALRETDDGVLPGDGVTAVRIATASSTSVARRVIAALMSPGVDLLTPVDRQPDVIRLRGFVDAYAPLLKSRARKAAWATAQRAREAGRVDVHEDVHVDAPVDVPGDVPATLRAGARYAGALARGPDPTGPDPTDIPPTPPQGGASAAPSPTSSNGNGQHLRPREQRRLAEERRVADAKQRAVDERLAENDQVRRAAATPESAAQHIGDILDRIGHPRPGASADDETAALVARANTLRLNGNEDARLVALLAEAPRGSDFAPRLAALLAEIESPV